MSQSSSQSFDNIQPARNGGSQDLVDRCNSGNVDAERLFHDHVGLGNQHGPDNGGSDSDHSSEDSTNISPEAVLERIERLVIFQAILEPLDRMEVPSIGPHRTFLHTTHCRTLTSIVLVASFCYELLQGRRTTTTREVYYHFVTHFRNQVECDKAIWDLASTLRVPRQALGLAASPKGWCCGCLELYNDQGDSIWNGRALDVHGMPITLPLLQATLRVTGARCILVIEKEGVYNRLSEDKFFLNHFPCILITGKGFPDVATRQWVHHLHQLFELPVYGLCDCNPYGISVLNTYQYDQVVRSHASKQSRPSRRPLNMKWLGLRPSQISQLDLPPTVFQKMTDQDRKRLDSFLGETHPFAQGGDSKKRREELLLMEKQGRKVELEALNWLGMDFLCQWVQRVLLHQEQFLARGTDSEDQECVTPAII